MDRRAFLKAGSLALFSSTLGGTPLFLTRTAHAANSAPRRRTLVCLFQRGAMDGLMAVQPLNDSELAKLRPQLHMTVGGENGLLALDGKFGLHPAFSPLAPFFKENRLAIVHGVGSPDTTRSHFDAQDYMESGTPGRKGTSSGWLNRAVGLMGHEQTPFLSVAMTTALPRSLYGTSPALAISNLDDFQVKGGQAGGQSLESLYKDTNQELLRGAGKDTFEATRVLSGNEFKNYKPAAGANYPRTNLGRSLRQIAQLIKAQVGLEVAFAEQGGWDTHVQQGTGRGTFQRNASDLAESIAAFWTDLGNCQDDVVLMTMTEFGRTVKQNGSNGTDHGRGSCMFILGNKVKGGRVHGNVPILAPENLEESRDLPVTTDFRSVFADVAETHLKLKGGATAGLFPGWNGKRLPVIS